MKQIFTAEMDNSVKLITTIIHFGLLPIPFFLYYSAGAFETFLMLALIVPLFLLTYLLRPFQYVLDTDKLVVRKNILPKTINLTDIKMMSTVEYKDLKIRLRLYASGGVWGWFGYFLSAEYGNVLLQCTTKKNLILITTKDDKYIVLSPADVKGFCETFEKLKRATKK
ncbi:MAG: hypothetical protein IT256_03845 [Chitinophagaceae bacterium]|nr:hypothetical protein [Chitinophagaceae bacterium]